jgi:hypothetical protein
VARTAGLHVTNLGLGGSCHLDQFVARHIRDGPADVISLKLGINVSNQASLIERTFVPTFHGFVDTIRDGHPDTPIVVASPIICPSAEDRPGPCENVDGLELFGPDDVGDLPDDLHPNGDGYERIGERFAALVFGPNGLVPRN